MSRCRLSVVVLLCVTMAAAAGCTQGSARDDTDCVEGANTDIAADGEISAGPFDRSQQNHWGDAGGTKLWVATSVDQAPTAATIEIQQVAGDDPVPTTKQTRGTDQIAQTGKSGLFYPGVIRLPKPGSWRLIVTIGADTGCFLVTRP